jgi:hypothetical protein
MSGCRIQAEFVAHFEDFWRRHWQKQVVFAPGMGMNLTAFQALHFLTH